MPNSVTYLGSQSFASNNLSSLSISNNLTNIGNGAFYGSNLSNVTIPSSVINIGNSAFQNNNLSHITIPSSVTNIDYAAFRDNPLATVTSQGTTPATIFMPGINDSFWARSVIDLTIPIGTSSAYAAGGWTGFNSVTEAAASAVGNTFIVDYITYEVTSVSPDKVKTTDYDMAGGTVVNIPDTVPYSVTTYDVTGIGLQSFTNNALTDVTIGENVTVIEFNAFYQNQIANSIIIPNSVTTINERAFDDNQISNVIIGSSVTTMGLGAFRNNSLTNVTSLAPVAPTIVTSSSYPSITDSFSYDRSNINLIIPNNTTDEYVTDTGALWTGFKMVYEVISTNTLEVTDYDATNGTIVTIPAIITGGSVVYDVIEIGNAAFFDKGLTSVTIPDGITTIGTSAFNTNSLTSVTIPDSVIIIGSQAFVTNDLTSISIGNNVTNIDFGAFADNDLNSVTFPSSVTNIGAIAFAANLLTSVTSLATIPPTITTGTNDTFHISGDRSNINLTIPNGTENAYIAAQWINFASVSLNISDFELTNNIKVITTTDELKVISRGTARLKNYSIYSLTGAKVKNGKESNIAINTLSNGIYVLELTFDTGKLVKKFAK